MSNCKVFRYCILLKQANVGFYHLEVSISSLNRTPRTYTNTFCKKWFFRRKIRGKTYEMTYNMYKMHKRFISNLADFNKKLTDTTTAFSSFVALGTNNLWRHIQKANRLWLLESFPSDVETPLVEHLNSLKVISLNWQEHRYKN